ncbi:MAG TPA: ABC transporter permease [Candidatus Acidoferrum sp.]|nr:ABC transporter permease [Candidatus Acidoferrum sp.]
METLWQDFRYALRLLRKSPGFAVVAILTLALGMSANTVMFSVLNTVLLRPLPYPHADRLVQIWETDARRGDMHGPVSPFNFIDWRSQSQSFEQMTTYEYNSVVLTGQKAPERLSALFVTASFFNVLKVSPVKGRTFLPDEDQPGKPRATVLSYGAWRRYFDSDPEIVGKSVLLDDQAYSIVGVMPPSFGLPQDNTELWCLPGFYLKQQTGRGSHGLFAVGRLKSDVSLQQAQTEMDTIAARLAATYHQVSSGVRLVSLQDEIVGDSRRSLLVLWLAVVAVLLIACANVAGLLMARAVSRQKEVAIRSALGGSRARLVQQFLTESVLLSALGGILGVALSYSAGRFVVTASHGAVPRLDSLQIDGRVLAFTAIACIVTGIAFGLAPAFSALRVDLNSSLKESGVAAQITDRLHLRSLFVVAEIALAMVLLIAGGLLAKTLWRLQHVDAGFKTENILAFRFTVPRAKLPDDAQRGKMYERIAERLAALPGVESVGATNDLPFGGSRSGSSFDIESRQPDPNIVLHAGYRTVSPGYFYTMRIRLLQGREFSVHDNRDGVFVAVVNQAFVKKFFPNEDPLGHRLKSKNHLYEIVGVVGDVKHDDLGAPSFPELYLCYLQADLPQWIYFAVRGRLEPTPLTASIREAMKDIAPEEPITRVYSMTRLLEAWMSPQKFNSLLLAIFAGLALVLAAIGIYGVIAYSVVQRTREIGIRMALGADRANVLRLILRQGARIGVLGMLIGTAAAYLSTRALSSMLYGVDPHDPLIFAAIAASLIVVVVLASYIPARRATRVDPLIALRYE